MSFYLFIVFLAALSWQQCETKGSESKFHDIRCRCDCEGYSYPNITAKVYTTNLDQGSCTCEKLLEEVNFKHRDIIDMYCVGCRCRYEVRSIKTMEAVVILYVSLILILLVYMLFTWVMEMVNHLKSGSAETAERLQLINEQPSTSSSSSNDIRQRQGGRNGSTSSFGHRLTSAQSEWKKQLKSQRDKVFQSRNVLQ